ncbi:Ig-like domain-containing protein [Pseudomonas sp. R9.37]
MQWVVKSRPFAKKLMISSLSLLVGCTSTVETFQHSSASNTNTADSYTASATTKENDQNLPQLGGGDIQQVEKTPPADPLAEGAWAPSDQQLIANPLNSGSKGADDLQTMVFGALNSAAATRVKDWFSAKNATAELSLSMGQRGGKSGSFDLLMPVFDTEADLVFTQFGLRRSNTLTESYRNTINIGAGWRHTLDKWLVGGNVFYDRDMTGKNDRIGLGAEAWTDFLKLSANGYFRLSEWKKSPDLEDYLERPANGYDMRVEANLPSYPQLGGKLVYEKYFGDQVGLFGSGNRQKDPSAVTIGVTYSPVALIGVGVDYRQGQGGLSETSAKLTLNYQFGVPLSKQLDPNYSKNYNLVNTRYDLVNRRNDIVLDYREKDAGQILLPAQVSGTPALTVSFPVTVTDHTIGSFTWIGTAAPFALPYGGGSSAALILPAYKGGGVNSYSLQAIGTDRFGRVIQSNVMQVRVSAFSITLDRSKTSVMADGTDTVMFTATLLEPSGAAKPDTPVTWDLLGNATVTDKDTQTDKKGQARLILTSRFASAVHVTVQEPQGAKAENNAVFDGDQRSARVVALVAAPETLTANGTSTSTLTATVSDANGNPVGAGAPITWSTNSGTLASGSTLTDSDSKATVVLTAPSQVGSATITAKAVTGTAATANVSFTADSAAALTITAAPSSITADGSSTSTLSATVKDAHGNLVVGTPVAWKTSAGTLASVSTTTNASGVATVVLTSSTKAESATVDAKAGTGNGSAVVTFTVNSPAALTVIAAPASITADGSSTSTLSATVKDAQGNLVAGTPVAWKTSAGTLASVSTTTNASGMATVVLTSSTTAGSATVDAVAGAGSGSAVVTFTIGNAAAVTVTAAPASITADGSSTSTLSATVKDAHGNLVVGTPVAWKTSAGTLASVSTTTNASGVATVVLTSSTTAGSATVDAVAGAGSSSAVVTFAVGNAAAVTVTAAPASITADGSSTSTLSAIVKDAHGNLVAGTPVAWKTSAGTLASASTTTNASGVATVVLTSSTTAGSATVDAVAGAGSGSAVVTFTIGNAAAVTVTAAPASITADGSSTSTLSATVKDAHGNLVAGTPVAWQTSAGTLASVSTTTNASGVATVVLTSSTTAGSATVDAVAGAGSSSAVVTFAVGNAAAVTVTATPASITADGSSTSTLSATVKDAHGNLVAGTPVAWKTSAGTLASASTTTNASGVATVVLTSSTTAGSATVDAVAGAGSGSAVVTFTIGSAAAVTVTAAPASITADGSSTSTLSAIVKDAHGNLVAGTPVAWKTSAGTLASVSTTTNASGVATVVLTSSTTAGSATVDAVAGAGSSSAVVTFAVGNAAAVTVTATPASITADGSSTSTLSATVKDAHGNLVAGTPVAWKTSAGTLASASTTTNASGVATVVLTSSTTAGSATVDAVAGPGSSSTVVTFTAGSPTALTITAAPASITADGSSTSTLSATVKDAHGNLVAGTPVAWKTSAGTLANASTTTNASGVATVVLTSSTVSGTATVTAKAALSASTVTVAMVADTGTAKVINLVATPTSITANGSDSSTLVATVQDAHGNQVGPGVAVNWSTSTGKVSNASSVTDASGKATITLTGTKAGTATVTASATAGGATATVQLIADENTARVVSVTATPSTIAANVEYGVQLVAMVEDANGNPLGAGVSVNWSSTPQGDIARTKTQTDASGKAINSFGGNVAGPYGITASTPNGGASTTVTVTANLKQARVTTLIATPTSVAANGTSVSVLVATVKDGSDNLVGPGVAINWTTDLGTLSGASSMTDANSQATVVLSSLDLGRATVTANAVKGGQSVNVTFVPDAATAQVVSLTSPRSEVVTGGIDSELFTATVKDALGHLVGPGVTVTWRNSDSRGTMSAPTSVTDANSQATMRLTSPLKYGSTTITAEAVKGGKSKDVVFISDVTTARILSIDVSPPYIVADGVDKTTFYANLTDANGNGFSSSITPLVVSWTTDFGTLSGSTSVSSNSSQAIITLTGNAVGVANVTASVTATGSGVSTKATKVTLTADNSTARVTSVTASPATITANGVAFTVLTATVRDVRGNLASSVQVPWTTNLGQLSSTSGWTDANGQVTTRLTGTVSGTATVTANAVAGSASANVILQ